MYCNNCGEGIQPADKFCSKCGHKVREHSNDQTIQKAEPIIGKEPEDQSRKQMNPFFILAGGIIAVFTVFGLVGFGIQWAGDKAAPMITSELKKESVRNACNATLQAVAKYQAKVETSIVELVGSGNGGHVTGIALYQNGFGAWSRKTYRCTVASPSDVYVYLDGELLNDLD